MAFDKALIEQRFSSHLDKYNTLASVQREICDKLSDKIAENVEVCRINSILEIGVGTGFLTSHLARLFVKSDFTLNDITQNSAAYVSELAFGGTVNCLWGDAEKINFPQNIDLIASASTIQWFDNLEAFIKKSRASLNDGGYLVLSTFGEENFLQIKQITGEGLTYFSPYKLSEMLVARGFEVDYIEQYTKDLMFNSPLEVLHHIKATGVNGITRERWTRKKLFDFSLRYTQLCPQKITLTYQPILLIARKKG